MTNKLSWLSILFLALGFSGCDIEMDLGSSEQALEQPSFKAMITLTDAQRGAVEKSGQATLTLKYTGEVMAMLEQTFPKWTSGKVKVIDDHLGNMISVAANGDDLVSVELTDITVIPANGDLVSVELNDITVIPANGDDLVSVELTDVNVIPAPDSVMIKLTAAERTSIIKNGEAYVYLQYSQESMALLKSFFPKWSSGGVYAKASHLINAVNVEAEAGPDLESIDAPDVVGWNHGWH